MAARRPMSTRPCGAREGFAEGKGARDCCRRLKCGRMRQLVHAVPVVDILVNNAGIFEPKDFFDIADDDWSRFFEVNVLSGVRLSRAYMQGMLQRNWGRIVFISSESGLQIPKEMIHYGVTKTAQLGVSRGLAELTRGQASRSMPCCLGLRYPKVRGVRRVAGEAVGPGREDGGGDVHQGASPDVADRAVCERRRGRQHGCLRLLAGGVGDQWRRAPCRRRRGAIHRLIAACDIGGRDDRPGRAIGIEALAADSIAIHGGRYLVRGGARGVEESAATETLRRGSFRRLDGAQTVRIGRIRRGFESASRASTAG